MIIDSFLSNIMAAKIV